MKYTTVSTCWNYPPVDLRDPKNNTNRCWIWNTTLPYKFGSHWSFVRITAGFLQINLCTKPTLRVTLQTKFHHSSILKCIVHRLPTINSIASKKNLEIQEVQKYLHPQRHLQLIGSMEENRSCTEYEIK